MAYNLAKQGLPFWKLVQQTEGCWNWTGKRDRNGYGQVAVPNRLTGRPTTTTAHRVSYEKCIGPIPEGLVVDHLCRNTSCVNPGHLEPVTQAENLLRGATFQARNAAKTHCINGHEFNEANTYHRERNGRPTRDCKTCRSFAAARFAARRSQNQEG